MYMTAFILMHRHDQHMLLPDLELNDILTTHKCMYTRMCPHTATSIHQHTRTCMLAAMMEGMMREPLGALYPPDKGKSRIAYCTT